MSPRFCGGCGTALTQGAAFCAGCGAPVQAAAPAQPPPAQTHAQRGIPYWTGHLLAELFGINRVLRGVNRIGRWTRLTGRKPGAPDTHDPPERE